MPELRYNPISQHWVIIAPERAARPEDWEQTKKSITVPSFKQTCPFCPGNEKETPPEVFRISNGKEWKTRVVPNKYAALHPTGTVHHTVDDIFHTVTGVGIHEVLIDHPLHNKFIAYMSSEEVMDMLTTYKERYIHATQDPRVETIILFKNHGKAAGTSLEHPHSQLIATPIIPTHIQMRLDAAQKFWQEKGECLFCHTLAEELQRKERIIRKSEHFVSFVPYAALTPYHVWVFPQHHTSSFATITEIEMKDLGQHLVGILKRLHEGLDNPDFNYSIRSIPVKIGEVPYFHWYLTLIPRITYTAGFELNSGMFINVVSPEKSAQFLRT